MDKNVEIFVPEEFEALINNAVFDVSELENNNELQNQNDHTSLPNTFEHDTVRNVKCLEPNTLAIPQHDQKVTEYIVDENSGFLIEATTTNNQNQNIGKNLLSLPYSSSDEETDDSSLDLFSLRHRLLRKRATKTYDNDRCKKVITRWRKSNPAKWNINGYKRNMSKCLEYSTTKGRVRPAKTTQNSSCGNLCRFKCTTIFNEDNRKQICKEYWGLKGYERKMDFILRNVDVEEPQSRRPRKGQNSKIRSNAKKYHFYKGTNKIRICQSFFMKMLNINNGPILTAFKKRNSLGVFEGEYGRGKKLLLIKLPILT
ncbi:uncharacterized protein LOC126742175 [Anthonomus grandis grandis]|uniref:uncharacterized protein LOC126742175 n=1 Tax=Anthonomus grandis grandis TaxID=2921223 RepID=UPI0021669213|nr:uncharacterized protein LOC126742175 [Anthonomus grandis grandis]